MFNICIENGYVASLHALIKNGCVVKTEHIELARKCDRLMIIPRLEQYIPGSTHPTHPDEYYRNISHALNKKEAKELCDSLFYQMTNQEGSYY